MILSTAEKEYHGDVLQNALRKDQQLADLVLDFSNHCNCVLFSFESRCCTTNNCLRHCCRSTALSLRSPVSCLPTHLSPTFPSQQSLTLQSSIMTVKVDLSASSFLAVHRCSDDPPLKADPENA